MVMSTGRHLLRMAVSIPTSSSRMVVPQRLISTLLLSRATVVKASLSFPSMNQQTRFKSRSSKKNSGVVADDIDDGVAVVKTKGKKGQSFSSSSLEDEPSSSSFDLTEMETAMKRSVERTITNVSNLVGSFGRAHPALLDSVKVTFPGDKKNHPLRDFAAVGVRDGQLIVTCFDVEMVKHVERAIYSANLGLTPQSGAGIDEDENILRVAVPKPTSESRTALTKEIAKLCESGKTHLRNLRHQAQKQIKTDLDEKVIGKLDYQNDLKKVEAQTKKSTTDIENQLEKMKKSL